jgi:hypothetical protein
MPRYVCAANACINGALHLALTQGSHSTGCLKTATVILVCAMKVGGVTEPAQYDKTASGESTGKARLLSGIARGNCAAPRT